MENIIKQIKENKKYTFEEIAISLIEGFKDEFDDFDELINYLLIDYELDNNSNMFDIYEKDILQIIKEVNLDIIDAYGYTININKNTFDEVEKNVLFIYANDIILQKISENY